MPVINLLTSDVLVDLMLRASSTIQNKLALSQVSQLWRNVALDTPLLWSSVTGGLSKAYCYRVPLILKRNDWHAHAFEALLPYLARIETLEVFLQRFTRNANPLLRSNLQFPALQTLRLEGGGDDLFLWIAAPRLRSLYLEDFVIDRPKLHALLVPT
ncbi:hypothetical protein B0H17DRAFT_1143375 [Mycena rosella]|uniref:F-box domain-containing protein n=1 Tax=Mycena rosella TaxID=1033263 RepID=A0AAD7G896_MYCRO|nr:hypothetical protein B0H17DRAFT_1143375 [Mycena rosella]